MESLPAARCREEVEDDRRDLPGEPRRNCVANLCVLFRAIALEEVVIRKRLKAGGISHRQAATLGRVGMDEVMPVLGDVGDNRGLWVPGNLDPEAVFEWDVHIVHVAVIGQEARRELGQPRGESANLRIGRYKQVAVYVRTHVASGFVLKECIQALVQVPGFVFL